MAAKNYRSVGRWPASFTLLKKEFGRFGGREESWLFGRGCFVLFGRRGGIEGSGGASGRAALREGRKGSGLAVSGQGGKTLRQRVV